VQKDRDEIAWPTPRLLTFLNTSATTSPPEAALGIFRDFRNLQRPRQAPEGEVEGGGKNRSSQKNKKTNNKRAKEMKTISTRLPPFFFFLCNLDKPQQANKSAAAATGGGANAERRKYCLPLRRDLPVA